MLVLVEPAKEGHVETESMVEEKGVLAQIHITIGKGKSRVINIRQIRYTWGNPTPDTMDKIPKIPCISISNEDGKYLTELIKKGRVWVKLKSDASWRGYKKYEFLWGLLRE